MKVLLAYAVLYAFDLVEHDGEDRTNINFSDRLLELDARVPVAVGLILPVSSLFASYS
jgi:ATP-dependent DNA ligase